MEQILFKYLAGNRQLSLPGIGRFLLTQEAASPNISDQQMLPPVMITRFISGDAPEDYLFTRYVSRQMMIPEDEARKNLSSYIQHLLQQLEQNGKARISPIGKLYSETDDHIGFTAQPIPGYLQPVSAKRTIRQDEVHLIRVGEDEKTNVEMADLLAEAPPSKKRWWIAPLLIGLLALGYLAWHFSQNGSVASKQKITVKTSHGSL